MHTCSTCGKQFSSSPSSRRKFCSAACKAFQASKPRICIVCGVEFFIQPRQSPRKTCSVKCRNESVSRGKRGVKNPRWISGRSANLARWRSQAEAACRLCGSDKKLRLHHVVYDQHVRRAHGDAFDPANSFTICWDCHNAHHHAIDSRIPLVHLRPENIDFASAFLGESVVYYWIRYYEVEHPAELIRLGAADYVARFYRAG